MVILIWNEEPLSRYQTLPINVFSMHVMRVKSSSNWEAKASPATPLEVFLLVFLCGHFVVVVEVNPLCGQRRSLLAQIGSSNNRITLRRKFLIAIHQIGKKAYLKSNTVVCREDGALVSLLRQITILSLVAIKHLHIQETQRTQV